MNEQLTENLKFGIWVLFASGLIFEISPFKINPISTILGWIGNKLNRDVKKEITQLQTDVRILQTDLQDHKVESQRRDILDFADELMRGDEKTKENFDNIISLHDRYVKYIRSNNLENGQIDLAFDYISTKYKECIENNDFYVGK